MTANLLNADTIRNGTVILKSMNHSPLRNISFSCQILILLNMNGGVGKVVQSINMIMMGMGNNHIRDIVCIYSVFFNANGGRTKSSTAKPGIVSHPESTRICLSGS